MDNDGTNKLLSIYLSLIVNDVVKIKNETYYPILRIPQIYNLIQKLPYNYTQEDIGNIKGIFVKYKLSGKKYPTEDYDRDFSEWLDSVTPIYALSYSLQPLMEEENHNYSIITNLGCHYTCPYCIVKMNNLGIPETNKKVKDIYNSGKMNFSSYSGGVPCHLLDAERVSFYKSMQELLTGVELEMHTSYVLSRLNRDKELNFSRIVYHCLGK